MVFNRRSSNRSNGGSQRNNGNKRNGGRRGNRFNNKPDFKFQIHDSQRKGSFTTEKLTEAIVMKIQKEFAGGRWIAKSIRDKVKSGPPEPTLQISTKTDTVEKRATSRGSIVHTSPRWPIITK